MGCTPSKAVEKTGAVDATKAPEKVPTAAELAKQESDKKRLERIGVSAEPLPDFVPNPGFVIKSKRTNTFQKAFINVLHHELVPTNARFVTRDEQWSKDKKGEDCCVFTAVIPSETYHEIMRKPMTQPEVCAKIITLINDMYPLAKLDLDYTMPKIVKGFMGDELHFISSDPNAPKVAPAGFVNPGTKPGVEAATATTPAAAAAAPAAATAPAQAATKPAAAAAPAPVLVNPHITLQRTQAEEKARLVHVPPKMQGWLKKKGHIVVNWKTRYFVLDSGYLTYFLDQLDVPPFGKDKKGQVSLAGYRVEQYKSLEGSLPMEGQSPPELQYRIQLILSDDSYNLRAGKVGEYQELILEAASLEEKLAWLAAINAHTHYIESSLKIAAQVEKAAATPATPAPAPAPAAAPAPVPTPVPAPAVAPVAASVPAPAASAAPHAAAATTATATTSAKEIPVPPTPNVSTNTPSAAALSLAASVPTVATTATSVPAAAAAPAKVTPPAPAPAPAPAAVAPPAAPAAPAVAVTATNDPKPWMVYVNASLQETIVLCGVVNKPNPMGKQMIRELILTSRKRLVYVDSQSLEAKGEIDWNTESGVDHFVKIINPTTFEVHHATDKKVYKFITKDDLTAQHWVDAINSVKKPAQK